MKNKHSDKNNTIEIDTLVEELHRLNTSLTTVTKILTKKGITVNNTSKTETDTHTRSDANLKVGDIVKTIDSYGVKKGTKGAITRLTPVQAYVKPLDGGKTFRKYQVNLKRTSRRV